MTSLSKKDVCVCVIDLKTIGKMRLRENHLLCVATKKKTKQKQEIACVENILSNMAAAISRISILALEARPFGGAPGVSIYFVGQTVCCPNDI